MYSAIKGNNLGNRDKKKCPQESQSVTPKNKTIEATHYYQSGTYLWAKGGGGAKDSHIICSAALESILNVDVATVKGGPWRKGAGASVAYGWGTSKDECSWAMGGDLKLGEVGIDIEVINGLLCTVVGVMVRSSSLSNPLFSDRQSCRFKRNLFLLDVADLLELLLCTLPAGLLTSIL